MSASAKAFYADLARVIKCRLDHASEIRRGDSDGEVTFKYLGANVEEPLEIQVLATDLNSYPDGTSYMVFTSSDSCGAGIVKQLEQLSAIIGGLRLEEVINRICSKLKLGLEETHIDADSDSVADEDAVYSESEDADTGLEDFETVDAVDEEYYEPGTRSQSMVDTERPIKQDIDAVQRIQMELKAATLAGFSIGIYSLSDDCPAGIVSLSTRPSKLDLSSATIGAWGLETTDYLVLLVKFLAPYPDLATLLSHPSRSGRVAFRFGKCRSPKPSMQCARMAFQPILHMNDEPDPRVDSVQMSEKQDQATFSSIYMSNTMNDLLNRRFFKLLKIRRDCGCSWDMAQELLNQQESQDGNDEQHLERANFGQHDQCPPSPTGSTDLHCDGSMEEEDENLSYILLAMQFSLRRLRKCTEYCMVCHQRRGTDIETLKPYVCSKSLCLYQYLSLAFGTSLEAEIINNPHVVDLLISLFYVALTGGRLREFPRGLTLKVPHLHATGHRVAVDICLMSQLFRITLDETYTGLGKKIREGDWVLVMLRTREGYYQKRVFCVSHRLDQSLYSYQEIQCISNIMETPERVRSFMSSKQLDYIEGDWLPAILFPYSYDVDDLDQQGRVTSLRQLLDATPSVLEMRQFLLEAPGRSLGRWSHINRSALSLVRWIVASNTSYIVQDSTVPVPWLDDRGTPRPPSECADPPEWGRIEGVGKSWMQFRFAQGSPDKESTFAKAVRSLCSTDASKADHPTLLAWHGSSLCNWHSIIRTGLDFSQELNGRSFGHGVYLSSQMNVGRGYARTNYIPIPALQDRVPDYGSWLKSGLRPTSALSICEIVNCPDEFVSKTPHFVVDKTEWIQCRYLLVQVTPTEDAIQNAMFNPSLCPNKGYIQQDPAHPILGESNERLEIPMTATMFVKNWQRDGSPGAEIRKDPVPISTLEGQNQGGSESGDDPEVLTERLLAMMMMTWRERKRSRSRTRFEDGEAAVESVLTTSRVDGQRDLKAVATASKEPPKPLTFYPGTLDLTTLPLLPEPAWAASSRTALQALTREVRELFVTQSRNDAASLGWYLDTAKVANLFQWIVELHSFDEDLPLAKDMMKKGDASVVLEIRFGSNFPMSPPFARVIRPRLLPFQRGGGGYVTAGGAICSEMLTSSGWSPVMSMEKVFLQIRVGLCDGERPARLDTGPLSGQDYGIGEAMEAYERAARTHGWMVPWDWRMIGLGWGQA